VRNIKQRITVKSFNDLFEEKDYKTIKHEKEFRSKLKDSSMMM